MADLRQPGTDDGRGAAGEGMFREPVVRAERSFPTAAVVIAVVVALVVVVGLALLGRTKESPAGAPGTLQRAAAYAPNLKLSNIQMSESTSFSGGKETYVDGHITNNGPATVTGVTAQVLFSPEGGGAPQMETVPLLLIRMRQPELDTEPMSAAPLAPGAGADFRMIFDTLKPEWDQQTPEIHITGVTTR